MAGQQRLPPVYRSDYAYRVAPDPNGKRLRAWERLRECERRLGVYQWYDAMLDPTNGEQAGIWQALNDALNAFLLTFESTLQLLGQQDFDDDAKSLIGWLAERPAYDYVVRGLRTLRHFVAHVDQKRSTGIITVTVGTGPQSIQSTRHLPAIAALDLDRVKSKSKLAPDELAQWNGLVEDDGGAEILMRGLTALRDLLAVREGMASQPMQKPAPARQTGDAAGRKPAAGPNAVGANLSGAVGPLGDGELRRVARSSLSEEEER